jgi:dethiobiotin synthetase
VSAPAPLAGLFVTGTDTAVGKTTVAIALLAAARRLGLRPVPFKPVETGCNPDPEDAVALRRAAGSPLPLSTICPYALRLPAAPAAAAAAQNLHLDVGELAARGRDAAAAGDFLLVEGAGGLLVPYAGAATAADLAAALRLPLLVVARTALGTVNHTALTLREAARSALAVAGLVLNRTVADAGPHEAGNVELIAEITGTRALGTFPFLPEDARRDPERAADALLDSLGEPAVARLLRPGDQAVVDFG